MWICQPEGIRKVKEIQAYTTQRQRSKKNVERRKGKKLISYGLDESNVEWFLSTCFFTPLNEKTKWESVVFAKESENMNHRQLCLLVIFQHLPTGILWNILL